MAPITFVQSTGVVHYVVRASPLSFRRPSSITLHRTGRHRCNSRRQLSIHLASDSSLGRVAREKDFLEGKASPLPDNVKELIASQKHRPIFDTSSAAVPKCAIEAQNASPPRFLTDAECASFSAGGRAARLLRDLHVDIIQSARREVILSHPGIDQPGGGLYPAFRADACWRDLQDFVRVTSYGCVCVGSGTTEYLNAQGCAIMGKLYSALEVPRPAMLTGLRACAKAALNATHGDEDASKCIEIAFEKLIGAMEKLDNS